MRSSVYPSNRVERTLPCRWSWRRPQRKYLLEQEYRRGPPRFDPFPSVYDVIDATLCPVAIVHKFFHGFRGAFRGPILERAGIGELYHELIAYIKTEISLGRRSPGDAMNMFYEFCERRRLDEETESSLRSYFSYWLVRKRDELEDIWNRRHTILFEVHVASINVTFGTGTRVPLHGVIDEIDITNKRVVERTIRGSEIDRNTPILKDYQVWLLWKILTSIDRSAIPEIWRNEDFQNYELIVETPYRDYRIDKSQIQSQFERLARDALIWIQDISRNRAAVMDAWRNRGHLDLPNVGARSCIGGDNVIEECSLAYSACYRGQRRYPERRQSFRAALRPLYRALFYEQLWNHDLFLYQIIIMEQSSDQNLKEELRSLLSGKVLHVEMEPLGNGRFLLRVNRPEVLMELQQEEYLQFDIIFGSFSMGIKRKAVLDFEANESNLEDGVVVAIIENAENLEGFNAYIVRGLLVREDPWYLKRIIQRNLFRLEKWGVDRDDIAQRHTTIQLIDTIFGPRTLRARRG